MLFIPVTRPPAARGRLNAFIGPPPPPGMAIGDVEAIEGVPGTHYVDTGMYDTPGYGAVYVIDAERPALVETGIGADRERVLDAIGAAGLSPADVEVIAVTHVHLDHAGGAGFLAADCPDATVYAHGIGAPHLIDPARLWEGTKAAVGGQIEYYVEPRPIPGDRVVELEDGDEIDLGDRLLRAHHAPGHAPHQVVFEYPGADAVFVGDAAGLYVPGRDVAYPTSPPPNFDPGEALADTETVADLDPERLLYTHFGPAPTGEAGADPVTLLDAYADRLRAWVDDVERAHEELGDEEAVIEQFVAESDLDAVWGEKKARYEMALNVRGVLRSSDR
jgi:glyoxylase-like metal-dependent hydrolase (beta-lactamase superfamily II)